MWYRVPSYQIGPDLEAGNLQTALEEHEPEPLPIHLVHIEGRRAAKKFSASMDVAAERLRRLELAPPFWMRAAGSTPLRSVVDADSETTHNAWRCVRSGMNCRSQMVDTRRSKRDRECLVHGRAT